MSQSPKVWLYRASFVFAFLTVGALALAYRQVSTEAEEQIAAYVRGAAPYVEAYCAAQSAVDGDPFFLSARGEDAGTFLNGALPWDNGPHGTGRLALPAAVRKAVSGPDWLEEGAHHPLPELDFGWMTALHRYDGWSVASQSPLSVERRDPFSAPLPDFRLLEAWSKLRFLSALQSGGVTAAAADVRRLAQLTWDTQLIPGARSATRLLRLEWEVWEHLARSGTAPDWKPVPAETLLNLERIALSGGLFRLAVLPRPSVDRLLACSTQTAGKPLLIDQSILTGLRRHLEQGDDGRHAAVLLKLGEFGALRLTSTWDTWFTDDRGNLREEALEALTEQRGVLGKAARHLKRGYAVELVSLLRVSEFLPTEETFREAFQGRRPPPPPVDANRLARD